MSVKNNELSSNDMLLLDKIAKLTINVDNNLEIILNLFKKNKNLKPPKDLYYQQGYQFINLALF